MNVREFVRRRRAPGLSTTNACGASPHSRIRQPDDRDFLHGGMAQQHAFDLDGRDVLAAADDDVLQPIADLDVAIGVDDRSIAACGTSRRGWPVAVASGSL